MSERKSYRITCVAFLQRVSYDEKNTHANDEFFFTSFSYAVTIIFIHVIYFLSP